MAFTGFTGKISAWSRGLREWLSDWLEDFAGGGAVLKFSLFGVALCLLISVAVGVYWSAEPEAFDVRENAAIEMQGKTYQVVGAVTISTLIGVAELLLDKPGGFLSNDILPPGALLDNIPNWEYGVLIQVRDMNKAMREAFSRSQSQSSEDNDLARAESRFNFDHDSWAVPASESEYRQGIKFLNGYRLRLVDDQRQNAQFYARADNLRYWLSTVESRLGSLSQRLSASVGQRRLNTDLANEERASQSTPAPREMEVKTPWLEIDDVFYEARGSAWALTQFLRAVEVDFGSVLAKKNALVSLQQIIRELESTQETVYSPLILNGSGFGLVANHSLVMASYISRANAGIIDLRRLLEQG